MKQWRTLWLWQSRLTFADRIAFVSFYAAEHVLSAIAKFLVYLLAEGERWGPRRGWEGRVGEERGKKRASVSRGGKWECMQNSPKMLHIWHYGDAPWRLPPRGIIFRQLFLRATFASQIVWSLKVCEWPKIKGVREALKCAIEPHFWLPHLQITKDISTKRGEDTSGTSIMQNFAPIGHISTEISVLEQKIQKHTEDNIPAIRVKKPQQTLWRMAGKKYTITHTQASCASGVKVCAIIAAIG